MNSRSVNQDTRQSGFTIMEVLIALAIFSIGVMAVGLLQTRSLKTVTSSQQKTLAMEALDAQVAFLRQTPLYSSSVWTGQPNFVLSPAFTRDHTQASPGTVQTPDGQFTVSWWVGPYQTIHDRWTAGPDPVTGTDDLMVSENVTVTVAKTAEMNQVLNTAQFVKYVVN